MTTAIIIVILIVFLSIGLFFLIKNLSNVSDIEPEIFEEGSITDFKSITHTVEDDNNYKDSSKAQTAIIISKVYLFYNKFIKQFNKLIIKLNKRQVEKIKSKEKLIQEAIKRDLEEQQLEANQKKEHIATEIDTSHFEVESIPDNKFDSTPQKVKEFINPETKATDFVDQLLSEADAISDVNSEDISDTYYYEYMEKRYIDKIVANAKDIEAYKKLGDLYVDMRNYEDALEAFQYVLKLKPNDTLSSRRVKDINNRLQKQN